VRKRKLHAGTDSHKFTACGLPTSRRYVAHPTAGADVDCSDCLHALVDLLSWADFQRYLKGERVSIPHDAEWHS
jgi:hypothetical protein